MFSIEVINAMNEKAVKEQNINRERLTTLLYNAISCLEEYGCDGEQLKADIGITDEEYKKIME